MTTTLRHPQAGQRIPIAAAFLVAAVATLAFGAYQIIDANRDGGSTPGVSNSQRPSAEIGGGHPTAGQVPQQVEAVAGHPTAGQVPQQVEAVAGHPTAGQASPQLTPSTAVVGHPTAVG